MTTKKPKRRAGRRFVVEWKEQGKWVRSVNPWGSQQEAEDHAKMIGAIGFRIVEIRHSKLTVWP